MQTVPVVFFGIFPINILIADLFPGVLKIGLALGVVFLTAELFNSFELNKVKFLMNSEPMSFNLPLIKMPRSIFLFLALILAVSFKTPSSKVPVYTKFADFEPLLHQNNDTTYVINFWATWCKPCVAELPFFDALETDFKNEKLKVILVSMDFENRVQNGVIPFIKERNIKSKVVVLDAPAQHNWIPKIDKNWSGAIPATYIYKGKKSKFYEQSFTKQELHSVVKSFL